DGREPEITEHGGDRDGLPHGIDFGVSQQRLSLQGAVVIVSSREQVRSAPPLSSPTLFLFLRSPYNILQVNQGFKSFPDKLI
ncbi:hypothetical protein BHM03_00035715, partial [Ensete ventricosum]